MRALLHGLALLCLVFPRAGAAQAGTATKPSSCVACHSSAARFDAKALQLVADELVSVHAKAGLSCQDCHGGNPDPALSDDRAAAESEAFAASPFHGVPSRRDFPAACGHCHSDPAYMHRFKPDAHVDQEREYRRSRHGQLLAAGDDAVATCVDCHGSHGILSPGDPEAKVYPTRVAETCKRCHADPVRMAGRKLPDGRPLPIDQYARWRRSVHAAAMYEKEDLSAPTCNDCHGTHGASPPGVGAVGFVCGECHGREAELFEESPKRKGFQKHTRLLAKAPDEGCPGCHSPPDPSAQLGSVRSLPPCTPCHDNHAVVRPTLAMLFPLPATPCAVCHGDEAAKASGARYDEVLRGLLERAASGGITGEEERFDFLVDQTLVLPAHTRPASAQAAPGAREPRPEFRRLFEKLRIGPTHFTYEEPVTGATVRERIKRCSDCHAEAPDGGGEPVGLGTSKEVLDGMLQLTTSTARAGRLLLAARRGGVEVRSVQAEVDRAVDAQIELEVLVHGFAAGEGSAFRKKRDEGVGHATAALAGAGESLEELAFRRRGLAVSLALIACVLGALVLKIRQLPREP